MDTEKGRSVVTAEVPMAEILRYTTDLRSMTGGRGPDACIDAVGLTTAAGKTTWATSSDSSSVYGGGSLSASSKKKAWYSLW